MGPPPALEVLQNGLHGFRGQPLPESAKLVVTPLVGWLGEYVEQLAGELDAVVVSRFVRSVGEGVLQARIRVGPQGNEKAVDGVVVYGEAPGRGERSGLSCEQDRH